MDILDLIRKDGLAKFVTATSATMAILEVNRTVTVAEVATVAVTVASELQVKSKTQPISTELSADEESRIRAWLAHLNEIDMDIIAEALEQCRDDLEARRCFLKRAEEVPAKTTSSKQIIYGDCCYLKRINHPALGHCTKGELEAPAGIWDTDHRHCEQFKPLIHPHRDDDMGLCGKQETEELNPMTTLLSVMEDK